MFFVLKCHTGTQLLASKTFAYNINIIYLFSLSVNNPVKNNQPPQNRTLEDKKLDSL